jgi:hypothetical protein
MPALPDAQKLLAAEREILGGDRIVMGCDDPLSVVALGLLDGTAIDAELTERELPKVLAVAGTREQLTCSLGVILARGRVSACTSSAATIGSTENDFRSWDDREQERNDRQRRHERDRDG